MAKLLLATRNPGKVEEISAILAGIPMTIIPVGDLPGVSEVDEDGATLEENALKKARSVFAATGIPALADDTGLEVVALGMEPGVRSARYAGEGATYAQNNAKLLAALAGVPAEGRGARFRCVAAYVDATAEHCTEGACTGVIAPACRGEGGFGYDPLFVPDGFAHTFAELPPDIKNAVSHRALAFRRMREYLMRRQT